MRKVAPASQVGERYRFHCASLLVLIARSILSLTQLLFQMRILGVTGVKYGLRASEAIRQAGWRLVRSKAHQHGRAVPPHSHC
jgi:hypothetical protein